MLLNANVSAEVVNSIKRPNSSTPLHDLTTKRSRDSFYKKELSYIPPAAVKLGERYVTVKGRLVKKDVTAYKIPFLESIVNLLHVPEIWKYVNNGHASSSGFMCDIGDGNYVKSNDLFSRNPKALQIILNTDDIEIVNPIGSHTKKHKLSMFYFTLANIPPELRSGLHAIQLLGVAKAKDIRKYGPQSLLDEFITTVRSLSSGGINVEINGEQVLIEGNLVIVPCDTLAAQWLAGFKEGVGFAHKACRECEATQVEMQREFVDSNFRKRDEEEHKRRCDALESPLSKEAKTYWSKEWGVNTRSCLSEIPDFKLCSGFVQDPMHILLEGLVPYELKLLLTDFVKESKYFTLKWLNFKILSFPYTYLECAARPEIIDANSLKDKGRIKQTSAAMMTLITILPLVVADKVPKMNEKWLNFLRLVQMTLLATSPTCMLTTAALLRQFTYEHHTKFVSLYPRARVIPKMHYCLHLPEQLVQYGPLRNHWCMRFEAKHGFFKTKKWRCFKNLPLSISTKHQKYMCYKQHGATNGKRSESFLYAGDIVKEGDTVVFQEAFPHLVASMTDILGHEMDENFRVYGTNDVVILGRDYTDVVAVWFWLTKMTCHSSDLLRAFSSLKEIQCL
ncbi:uncharacterized protein LOC135156960 [Lytechinus pictus]|uniref:uncharacterized protein LOC135156960 n=1 Tax=Lytechinus pictus TaxID=7653 RepID=UPI0030B9EC62